MRGRFFVARAIILFFTVICVPFPAFGSTGLARQTANKTPVAGTKGYTNPKCAYCPAPSYSKEGLKRKIQGNVLMSIVVGTDGRAHNIIVTHSLGYGLDEQAIKVLRDGWTFKPANDPDGKPVAVHLFIEVNFHLY